MSLLTLTLALSTQAQAGQPLAIPERGQPRPPAHAQAVPARDSRFRQGSWAVGLRMGSLVGGYKAPRTSYADFGLGLNVRYRPAEPLALELAFTHHDDSWRRGTQRAQLMGQASVIGFLFPRSMVSPYALGGITGTGTFVEDTVAVGGDTLITSRGFNWGPHAGLGVEIALGDRWALDADLRTVGYVNVPRDDATFPVQLQANLGVLTHF